MYNKDTFEERLKENIRGYRSADLYDLKVIGWQMEHFAQRYGIDLLLTDRHGERAVVAGNFEGFSPDVVKKPGKKIRIFEHTIGHLYIKDKTGQESCPKEASEALDILVRMLESWGEKSYLANELEEYKDELEARIRKEYQAKGNEKKDVLTGTLNKTYFESRMKIIDRSEVAPVALIQANINDWKFVHDHYGIEESDRLIMLVAGFLKKYAKPDYVIGRCGGDWFNIVIPIPEAGEAQDYVQAVIKEAEAFQDEKLAPSVAFGVVYKENVEESLFDKLSDAEYEMFSHKLEQKKAPGYRERLEKGMTG